MQAPVSGSIPHTEVQGKGPARSQVLAAGSFVGGSTRHRLVLVGGPAAVTFSTSPSVLSDAKSIRMDPLTFASAVILPHQRAAHHTAAKGCFNALGVR